MECQWICQLSMAAGMGERQLCQDAEWHCVWHVIGNIMKYPGTLCRFNQRWVVSWMRFKSNQPDPTTSHENETHACRFTCLCRPGAGRTNDDPGEVQGTAASEPGEKYFPPLRTQCTRATGQHRCTHRQPCEQKGPRQDVPQSSGYRSRPEIISDVPLDQGGGPLPWRWRPNHSMSSRGEIWSTSSQCFR